MSNEEENLNKFLVALDSVKQDYTCGVCSELCTKPVVLSTCFHIICSSHFADLTQCPNCKIPLLNCTVYEDDRLERCVTATQELGKIFEVFKKKTPDATSKSLKCGDKNRAKNTSQLETLTSGGTSKRRGKLTSDPQAPTNLNDKENKPEPLSDKVAITSKTNVKKQTNRSENLNASVLSSTSSKINNSNEKKNNKGETPLHIACRLGKIDKIIELLNQGANTNTKDNAGWTPLHEVVQNGRLDLVQLLLKYNTLIDVPGQSNETPLHEAIRYNHWKIAVELVKNGANVKARNCKGETPLELASEELRSLLKDIEDDFVEIQGVQITHLAELHTGMDNADIRVYCISTNRTVYNNTNLTVLNKLKLLAKHHSNLHIEYKLTKKVTHLIVDTHDDDVCTSSLEVLQAIVSSIWVLSANWIAKSTEEKLEPFQDYEVLGVGTKMYNGPRNSRYNKYKQLPGIFNGCHFYLHNFNVKHEISKNIVVTKAWLTKLIVDAGGVVLRRVPNPELIPESERLVPYHAKEGSKLYNCSHYIIFKDMYEPMYNMSHIKALPIGWLIECIESYELCEPW